MSRVQIIRDTTGRPAFVVLTWDDYRKLDPNISDAALTDEELYDAAIVADEEHFPVAVADRLMAGDHPVKVFREHRGLTQKRLAAAAGVDAAYLSQIETGHRRGSIETLQKLARALNVDLDDLAVWPA